MARRSSVSRRLATAAATAWPKLALGGDQDRLRAFVVFGLAEEVERDPVRVIVGVGDDEDFGRPGDHVDADAAKDPTLGGGDEGVAGAGDLVDGAMVSVP